MHPPVSGDAGQFAANNPFDLGKQGFVIIEVDAVIPDQGVGEDQNLVGKGLVGDRLLVAGHAGGKDHFTGLGLVGPKGGATVSCAVF